MLSSSLIPFVSNETFLETNAPSMNLRYEVEGNHDFAKEFGPDVFPKEIVAKRVVFQEYTSKFNTYALEHPEVTKYEDYYQGIESYGFAAIRPDWTFRQILPYLSDFIVWNWNVNQDKTSTIVNEDIGYLNLCVRKKTNDEKQIWAIMNRQGEFRYDEYLDYPIEDFYLDYFGFHTGDWAYESSPDDIIVVNQYWKERYIYFRDEYREEGEEDVWVRPDGDEQFYLHIKSLDGRLINEKTSVEDKVSQEDIESMIVGIYEYRNDFDLEPMEDWNLSNHDLEYFLIKWLTKWFAGEWRSEHPRWILEHDRDETLYIDEPITEDDFDIYIEDITNIDFFDSYLVDRYEDLKLNIVVNADNGFVEETNIEYHINMKELLHGGDVVDPPTDPKNKSPLPYILLIILGTISLIAIVVMIVYIKDKENKTN